MEMTVVADREGFWLVRNDPAGGELVRIRAWAPALAAHVGSRVVVGIRPEDLVVSDRGSIPAIVERRIPIPTGSALCRVAGAALTATINRAVVAAGDAVRLRIDHMVVFDKLTGAAIA